MNVSLKNKGVLYAAASATGFGLAVVLGKLSYDGGNTAISLTFYRGVAAFAVLYMLLRVKGVSLRVPRPLAGKLILLGVLGQTLTTMLLNSAYYHIPVGSATTLHFIYPALVTVVSVLFFHERVSRRKLIILLLICVGIACFFEGVTGNSARGTVLAILSSVTWTFYIIFLKQSGLEKMNTFLLAFYQCAMLGGLSLVWGLCTGDMTADLTGAAWLATLASALLFVSAMILLQSGIKYAGATTAAMLGVFEPISSIVFGVMFLNEVMSNPQVIGSVIVMAAIVMLIRIERNQP